MHLKKGDTVKILTGKDQGKIGKVLQVLKKIDRQPRVVVEGLNLKFKHLRQRHENEKGQRIMFPAPLDVSNVVLLCPKCNQPTRVAFNLMIEKSETTREKKHRLCKKCKNII